MSSTLSSTPDWLLEWMAAHDHELWGAADLRDFATPQDENGALPFALSWAIPMNPHIIVGIKQGHNCGICSAVCPFGLKVLKRQP